VYWQERAEQCVCVCVCVCARVCVCVAQRRSSSSTNVVTAGAACAASAAADYEWAPASLSASCSSSVSASGTRSPLKPKSRWLQLQQQTHDESENSTLQQDRCTSEPERSLDVALPLAKPAFSWVPSEPTHHGASLFVDELTRQPIFELIEQNISLLPKAYDIRSSFMR
jgi:hypothetical protein